MTTLQTASAILLCYPERNPFEMDPPAYNLTPSIGITWAMEKSMDTPEFIAAARAQAQKTGCNPLWTWFGTNPLAIYDERIQRADLPFNGYTVPPPLPRIDSPSDLTYIERVNARGNNPMYKVRIGDDVRLLKLVRLNLVTYH